MAAAGESSHASETNDDDTAYVNGLDWAIVAVYLCVSITVGIYCGRKSQGGDSNEYLLAGKGMNGFVVAISSLGGSYSAVTLIGSSGWSFVDGMAATTANFIVSFPSNILLAELWVPIYRGLPNIVSCYQFLETRFSRPVRLIVSVIGNFAVLCYISVVLYAPALAISSIVPALGIFEVIFGLGVVTCTYTVYGEWHRRFGLPHATSLLTELCWMPGAKLQVECMRWYGLTLFRHGLCACCSGAYISSRFEASRMTVCTWVCSIWCS
jgi:hypothetical protein